MHNLKNFLISFGVGIVVFGVFAALIPGFFKEETQTPTDDSVQTGVQEETPGETPDDETPEDIIVSDTNKSFAAIVGGYDDGGELDALVFIKADSENEKFVVSAIPTYLSVPVTGVDPTCEEKMTSYIRLRDFPEVFSGSSAKRMLLDTVYAITGTKIDYYAFFNKDDLLGIFEDTGGIYYTVPNDMYYQGIGTEESPEINVSSGGQVLTAAKAFGLLRFLSYSNNEMTNERMRAATHAEFVSESLKQLVKIDKTKLASGALKVLSKCETNFGSTDFTKHLDLICNFGKYSASNVVMSLDTSDPIDYSHSQKLFENY